LYEIPQADKASNMTLRHLFQFILEGRLVFFASFVKNVLPILS